MLHFLQKPSIALLLGVVLSAFHVARAQEESPSEPVTAPSAGAGSVTINTGFAQSPVVLTPGEGRFNQPPFRYTVSISQGYDDNIFSSSGKSINGLPALEPAASAVTNGNLTTAFQFNNTRSVMVLDASLGSVYYWDKPVSEPGAEPKTNDTNGGLSFQLSHQVSPRMRVSASLNAVYQSDPDASRRYTSSEGNLGSYINGYSRLEMAYQWLPRTSTGHSYSAAGTFYNDSGSQVNNLLSQTLGNTVSFSWTPRTTLVGEHRYEFTTREQTDLETSSQYLLAGIDYAFSTRLRMSVRLGQEYRTYDSSGDKTTAPHLESTLSYVYGNGSRVNWTNWYGLDSSNSANQENTTYRTSLSVNQVLTARLSAMAAFNFNYLVQDDSSNPDYEYSDQTQDLTMGLDYIFSQAFRMRLYYTHTEYISDIDAYSYARNRIFVGGDYTF